MIFELRWSRAATVQLATISSWELQARIDRAMLTFTRTGEGRVEPARPHPGRYRLRAHGYVVVFAVDSEARRIDVLAVYQIDR